MYKYKVLENRLLTKSIRLITLVIKNPNDRPLLYQPGQYASISLKDKFRPTANRCFSIASSPTNQGILQFSIRVGGNFTNALERLKKDDQVSVRGPFGKFIFNQHTQHDLVMFAGGIGIAPFMSMIKYARDLRLDNKLKIIYSCSNQEDIPFFEEIQKIKKENSNFEVIYVIGKGATDKINSEKIITGRISENDFKYLGLSPNQDFMICGPIPYMESISEILTKNGVSRHKILTEAFSQSSKFKSNKLISWPVNSYALTGLSLIALTLWIGISDVNKSFAKYDSTILKPADLNNVVTVENGNLVTKINAAPPQIDTNTKQKPVVKIVSAVTAKAPAPAPASAPAPAPTPVPPPAPAQIQAPAPKPTPAKISTPTPTKTVTPVAKPKTKKS